MDSWYRITKDKRIDNKDSRTYIMVFETDNKDKAEEIELFYESTLPPIGNSYHRNVG